MCIEMVHLVSEHYVEFRRMYRISHRGNPFFSVIWNKNFIKFQTGREVPLCDVPTIT